MALMMQQTCALTSLIIVAHLARNYLCIRFQVGRSQTKMEWKHLKVSLNRSHLATGLIARFFRVAYRVR